MMKKKRSSTSILATLSILAGLCAIAWAYVPTTPVSYVLDDGASENSIGDNGQFIWFQRITPDPAEFPLIIDTVQVAYGNNNVTVGSPVQIVMHEDTDGDGDPGTGAVYLYTYDFTVLDNTGAYNTYTIDPPALFTGPGDILIGAVNSYGSEGFSDFPALLDQTASQGRSWAATYLAGDVPANPFYPADEQWGTIDSFGFAGNWLIRASGFTVAAQCGDGVTELDETCDDGNATDDGNGCDATCQRNDVCGDGVLQDLYETCDDGDAIDDGNGCSDVCQRNDVCGDGVLQDLFETCDDGNTTDDGNGCDDLCQANNICGDGTLQDAVETCDDGDQIDDGNGCDDICQRNDVCGDGVLQDLFETCDDGNTTDDGNGCDEFCQLAGVCGDGVVQDVLETCDDGNTTDDGNGCDALCQLNNTCGDGLLEDAAESCDDGDTTDSGNGCDATCQRNSVCGDGTLQDLFEDCDDGNVADDRNGCSATCQRNAVCGDGVRQDLYEECDDGNSDNNDSCSNTCTLAMVTPVEGGCCQSGDPMDSLPLALFVGFLLLGSGRVRSRAMGAARPSGSSSR